MADDNKKQETPKAADVFIIAEGKSLTSLKKILGPGDVVTEKAFDSKATFDKWIDKEVIVKKKVKKGKK